MATIIEIEETELEHLSECLEKMLRIGGKAMSCVEKLKDLESDEDEELPRKTKRRKSIKDQDDEYLRYY